MTKFFLKTADRKSMDKVPVILIFLQLAVAPVLSHAQSGAEKTAMKRQLLKRKKGFDRYIRERDTLKRLSERAIADIQKDRGFRAKKRRAAQENFRRKSDAFPFAAYRKFIKKRDAKREKKLSVKQQYRDYKAWLRKIEDQRRYKINKEKAYRLE